MKRKILGALLVCMATILFGAVLNFGVMSLNHDRMPVAILGCPEGYILDVSHAFAGPSTHLTVLSDCIYYDDSIYSLGDLFLYLGQAMTFCLFVSLGIYGLYLLIRKLIKRRRRIKHADGPTTDDFAGR